MAQVITKVLIKGGAGKLTISMYGQPDVNITQSGTATLNFPPGTHIVTVYGRPPVGGTVDVSFEQNGDVLDSHKYKEASVLPFKLEVS